MANFFALFWLLLLVANPALGFHRFLVVHSQSANEPSCPSGWAKVYGGYSLIGLFQGAGRRANQDLGSPGSCVERFYPNPMIKCTTDFCDYADSQGRSLWLVTPRYADEGGLDFRDAGHRAAIMNRVSRCAVCEGTNPIIVVHSQDNAIPNCPRGYEEMRAGYSLATANWRDTGDAPQDLGNTGSCLTHFVPNPGFECWNGDGDDRCDYDSGQGAYNGWLVNLDSAGDRSYRTHGGANNNNAGRVSRCRVCEKK